MIACHWRAEVHADIKGFAGGKAAGTVIFVATWATSSVRTGEKIWGCMCSGFAFWLNR